MTFDQAQRLADALTEMDEAKAELQSLRQQMTKAEKKTADKKKRTALTKPSAADKHMMLAGERWHRALTVVGDIIEDIESPLPKSQRES